MKGHQELTNERHELARQYLKQYSNCSRTSIARLLVDEQPLLFDDVERARNTLKYISGNMGSIARNKLKDKSQLNETKMKSKYGLTAEDHNDFSPYIIPKSQKKIGVIADIHIPYQDNRATILALDYFKEKQVDTIVINGDLMDFYAISRFVRNPNKRDLSHELDAVRSFINALRDEFPDVLIIFKTGNHEDRWKHFLAMKAPELFNMNEFKLDVIFNLNEKGIIFVDDKRMIKAGKLNIIHGHEYFGSYSPVNPAKGYWNKAMTNIMAGHNHQSSEHISKDANDEITGAWSLGCLCEMHPLYMPMNKWNLGFATIDLYDGGNFRVINKKILDYEIV